MERDAMNRRDESMDERLDGAAQQAMRAVVKGLPEDTLSMTWRSSLNERLLAEAATQQKQKRVRWFLRPALGLGLACTLAVVTLFRISSGPMSVSHPTGKQEQTVEAALVNLHRQSTWASDVAGVGLSPVEANSFSASPSTSAAPPSVGWSEEDLDLL